MLSSDLVSLFGVNAGVKVNVSKVNGKWTSLAMVNMPLSQPFQFSPSWLATAINAVSTNPVMQLSSIVVVMSSIDNPSVPVPGYPGCVASAIPVTGGTSFVFMTKVGPAFKDLLMAAKVPAPCVIPLISPLALLAGQTFSLRMGLPLPTGGLLLSTASDPAKPTLKAGNIFFSIDASAPGIPAISYGFGISPLSIFTGNDQISIYGDLAYIAPTPAVPYV